MQGNPLISIVIPTFNRSGLLKETLESILLQTYQNWECIVVDDGSNDTTEKIVNDYVNRDNRFKFHKRPADRLKGGNAARNYGFEMSNGEFVNWFDDDDVMLPNFLKNKIEEFKPNLELVICPGYYADDNLQKKDVMKIFVADNLFKNYVLWKSEIITNSVLIRRSFLENKKIFDDEIIRGQETEFFSRLFFKIDPNKYLILNEPLFLYRQHNETKSTSGKKYIKPFVVSQTNITLQNLRKSIELGDVELIKQHYNRLISFFFRGIENSHLSNSKHILKELYPLLKQTKSGIALEIKVFGELFIIIKRGSAKVEKRWKKKVI